MAAWFGTAVCAGFFLTPIRAKERQGHDRGAAGLGKKSIGSAVGGEPRATEQAHSCKKNNRLGLSPHFWVLPSPYVIIQKR
ncbi:hypothetical protein GS458_2829 [Geobacillus stearothermophilus]|nr:hypothetical protein GS458_2829 [Geobacillus stearothermophilus]